jgi:hypothetical protein
MIKCKLGASKKVVERAIDRKEQYRIGGEVFEVMSLSYHHPQANDDMAWGNTRFYQTKSGKLKKKW